MLPLVVFVMSGCHYDTHKATSCVAPVTTVYKFVVPPLWPECITNTPYMVVETAITLQEC